MQLGCGSVSTGAAAAAAVYALNDLQSTSESKRHRNSIPPITIEVPVHPNTDPLVRGKLMFGDSANASGAEVGARGLNTPQAAKALKTLAPPFRNQTRVGPPLSHAVVVQLPCTYTPTKPLNPLKPKPYIPNGLVRVFLASEFML